MKRQRLRKRKRVDLHEDGERGNTYLLGTYAYYKYICDVHDMYMHTAAAVCICMHECVCVYTFMSCTEEGMVQYECMYVHIHTCT